MNLLLHIHKNQDWLLTAVEATLAQPGGLSFFYLSVYALVDTQETILGENALSTILVLHNSISTSCCSIVSICEIHICTVMMSHSNIIIINEIIIIHIIPVILNKQFISKSCFADYSEAHWFYWLTKINFMCSSES